MAERARPKNPDDVIKDMESGVDQNLPFTMPYNPRADGTGRTTKEEALQEISKDGFIEDTGPSVRQLVTMRKQDGQARALYRLLTLPIRSALNTATFIPAEGGEKERDFIDQVFHLPSESGGMTVTFQRVMSQLLQAMFDGFTAFEKVFWIPEDGPLKGKITLKKLAYRPSETVTFITDKHGAFKGIRQQVVISGKTIDTFIPREYVFYYAAQEEERKFYGVSFFQSAFYHYDKKVKLYYTAHLAAQRAAVGTRVGTVPANASLNAKQTFSRMLANMSVAQWMTVPEGFKVDILRETGSFDFLNLINHHNSQMSKSVLASFFDQAQGGGSNDTSLVNFAQPGDEMFILMLRAVMDDIANQINHYIIPQLIDFNFKGGKYPKFAWGKLTDEQREAISSVFEKILSSGGAGNLPKEFVRALEQQQAETMGLEIDWDEVEAREEQEEVAEQEASAQQAAGQMGGQLIDPETGQPLAGEAPLGAEELGLTGDWSLEDFEEALDRYVNEASEEVPSGRP